MEFGTVKLFPVCVSSVHIVLLSGLCKRGIQYAMMR